MTFDGERFARQHRLIHQDIAIGETNIGQDNVADAQPNKVVRYDLGCGKQLPVPVPPDASVTVKR
jgi:hypothetical protein